MILIESRPHSNAVGIGSSEPPSIINAGLATWWLMVYMLQFATTVRAAIAADNGIS